MASKLRYGWETGEEPAPGTSGTVATVEEHPLAGTKCVKVTTSGYSQWTSLGYALDRDYWIRVPFYLDASPAGLARVAQILTAAGGIICNARLNTERKLQLYDSEGEALGSLSSVLATGEWHDLEVHVRVNTEGQGILGARLNGTELLPDAAATVGNTAIGRIRVGLESSEVEAIFHDSVGVNDDQGETDNTWQQALAPGEPVDPVNAGKKRRLGIPFGIWNVNNSSIKAADDFYAVRFVPDEDITLHRFIMGFNIEGVDEGPSEVKDEAHGGTGRDGYGDGDGGTIWARLVRCKADGTPNLDDVLAEEKVNAVKRYEESKAAFGIEAGKLTQLFFLEGGDVARKADEPVFLVIGNSAAEPLNDWFSINSPVVHEDEGGPHAVNTLLKYPDPDVTPIAGLDPRECCFWTVDGGAEWLVGAGVGGPDGHLSGYYDGIGAGEDGVRLPWYGYQQAAEGPIKAVQPYYAYEATGSYTLRCKNAAIAKTLTHAGGYAKTGENLGVVTVVNVTTSQEGSVDLSAAGSGIVSGELDSPVEVGAGETFTITGTGDVCLLQADSFIDKTFNPGDEEGEFPYTTDGEENNVAQLFVLPWPYYETADADLVPEAPVATTGAATNITPVNATLNGTVDPSLLPTTFYFEYGETEAYGTKIPASEDGDAGEGSEAIAVSEAIKGLKPKTTYHFRLYATNAEGEAFGEDLTFKTPPIRRRRKPDLALDIEVETPERTFRLPADARKARNRPQNLRVSTQRGDGFATGGLTLARPIFKEHPEISLLDTWRAISRSGDVAYEGRLHSAPRTNDPGQQIDISLVGWMTYLRSKKVAPLIIERRLGSWGEPSTQRKIDLVGEYRYGVNVSTGRHDTGEAGPGIIMEFQRKGERNELGELWFYGGGERVGRLRFDLDQLTAFAANTDYDSFGVLLTDDIASEFVATADLNRSDKEDVSVEAGSVEATYALVQSWFKGTSQDLSTVLAFLHPRVYGVHSLTPTGTSPEEGFRLTDIIEHLIRTYYPKIEWAGQENSFPVTQATWHDNPQHGYDILQQLNKLVLWESNVWEDRKLHFHPADLTRNDWQIRTDDPGVTVLFQGDSIENFANGITVTYTDFAGIKRVLYPPDHAELRDDTEGNPATRHGEDLWTDVEMPWPGTEAEALQFGRAYLAEFNRPKRPGTFRIDGGYIRDGAGAWHPGWKPRCSETIGVMDHPADEPRLITATEWDADGASLAITVDAPDQLLDAVIGRHELARQARNL